MCHFPSTKACQISKRLHFFIIVGAARLLRPRSEDNAPVGFFGQRKFGVRGMRLFFSLFPTLRYVYNHLDKAYYGKMAKAPIKLRMLRKDSHRKLSLW